MRIISSCTIASAACLAITLPSIVLADDIVAPWNKVVRDYVVEKKVGSSESTRLLAHLHTAQYQAVNDVLSAKKNVKATDAALQPELKGAVAGASKAVLDNFITVGARGYYPLFDAQVGTDELAKAAATRAAETSTKIVTARVNDGSTTTLPILEYKGSNYTGKWRPTPPDFKAGKDTQWGNVTPWIIDDIKQFRMAPPPALNSDTYRKSYTETKELGSKNSAKRTKDQTDIAFFWQDSPEITLFSVLDQLTANASIVDATKAYALASVAAADSRISAIDNKYFHSHWRPITSIQLGNGVNFEADPAYESLLKTPPFPEYPTGHGVLGATFAEVYKKVAGKDKVALSIIAPTGTTRQYTSFSQIADEVTMSRVYAGDHFRHTGEASKDSGKKIGQAVVAGFDKKYQSPTADKKGLRG